MKAKLSKPQLEVINKMNEGWKLGWNKALYNHMWLQLGELGMGGMCKEVNARTFNALERKGLIEFKEYGFHVEEFILTKKGLLV